MTARMSVTFHPGAPGRRLPEPLCRRLLWSCCLWFWSAGLALAASAANSPPPVPALDAAIVQSQAPGDSRLLVKRRTPLPGSLLNAPAPQLRTSIRMAYETALGNDLYTIKLFENMPLAYTQAVARALARQPDIVSASVLNDHDKVLYGTEMTVPFPAIHTDQAFDLYVPRKGGQNAPVVLILGCVGGDMPAQPGMPGLLILPNLAIAAAEQYGAVVACMSPAESETDLTHMSPAQLTTLAARQAANDAAIQGVLTRIGQLTGANTLRVKLVGGQTAVPADGPAIALRYAFTYPSQVDRLVLDNQVLPPVPQLPATHLRPPASRPLQLAMTALVPDTAPPAAASWIPSVQQLATQQHMQVQAAFRTYHDCGQDLACPIGPTGEMPVVFSALLGPPPAGTALLSLSVGPDRQVSSGGSLFLPELISGMVLGQAGSNAAPGLGWTSADGSPLPAGAVVTKSGLHEQLQFAPTQPGHYAFRLRLEDIKGNLVQAYANVEVPNPAQPATHLALAVSGPAQVVPGARVLLQARVTGTARPGDVLYEWQQTGGPVVTLPARNLPILQFTAPRQPARLSFRLLVTDPSGQVAAKRYTQQVRLPPPPPAKQPQPAKPPVVTKKPQPVPSPGPARKPLPARPPQPMAKPLPARPPQPMAKPLPARPPAPTGKPVLARPPLPAKLSPPVSQPATAAPSHSRPAASPPAHPPASA